CGEEEELGAERRRGEKPVVEWAVAASVKEDAEPAAQAGLGITEYVVGKADARGKIVQAGSDSVFGYSRIAREKYSGRRIWKLCRVDAGQKVWKPELLYTPLELMPRTERLIAQPEVYCQAAADVKIVLDIQASENVAIILEFPRALTKRHVAAVIAELTGQECRYRWKAEFRRLKEQIVEVDLAA